MLTPASSVFGPSWHALPPFPDPSASPAEGIHAQAALPLLVSESGREVAIAGAAREDLLSSVRTALERLAHDEGRLQEEAITVLPPELPPTPGALGALLQRLETGRQLLLDDVAQQPAEVSEPQESPGRGGHIEKFARLLSHLRPGSRSQAEPAPVDPQHEARTHVLAAQRLLLERLQTQLTANGEPTRDPIQATLLADRALQLDTFRLEMADGMVALARMRAEDGDTPSEATSHFAACLTDRLNRWERSVIEFALSLALSVGQESCQAYLRFRKEHVDREGEEPGPSLMLRVLECLETAVSMCRLLSAYPDTPEDPQRINASNVQCTRLETIHMGAPHFARKVALLSDPSGLLPLREAADRARAAGQDMTRLVPTWASNLPSDVRETQEIALGMIERLWNGRDGVSADDMDLRNIEEDSALVDTLVSAILRMLNYLRHPHDTPDQPYTPEERAISRAADEVAQHYEAATEAVHRASGVPVVFLQSYMNIYLREFGPFAWRHDTDPLDRWAENLFSREADYGALVVLPPMFRTANP